jgi:hypothetical protein
MSKALISRHPWGRGCGVPWGRGPKPIIEFYLTCWNPSISCIQIVLTKPDYTTNSTPSCKLLHIGVIYSISPNISPLNHH